jgi:hypothetical protein
MERDQMNSNLLGQDPLIGDTYYPKDFEGMLARVVRIDRATGSNPIPRRRLQLRSRMPIAIAVASLAGASLAGAGLAAAAASPSGPHASRLPLIPKAWSETISYGQAGLVFTPAPRGTDVAISAQDALAAYYQHAPMGPSGVPTAVELGYATAGSGPAPLSHTLVWLVSYADQPISYIPSVSWTATPVTPPVITGTWLGIVDASTGTYLYTEDFGT